MDRIPDASGHLYKHVMVLGTFLAMVSIYGMSVSIKAYDDKVEEGVQKVLLAKDVPAAEVQYWQRLLSSRQKNVYFTVYVLMGCVVLGVGMALVGGRYWYVRVQVFEDETRRLETQKLRQLVESKQKQPPEA